MVLESVLNSGVCLKLLMLLWFSQYTFLLCHFGEIMCMTYAYYYAYIYVCIYVYVWNVSASIARILVRSVVCG